MTQQPYPQQYQPQYPQAPQQVQQPYPQQQQAPAAYAPPVQQQPYPQQYAPPAPPVPPPAQGNLDDYYNQRSAGSGPGLSWQDKAGNKKPLGTAYVGVVARDVGNGDVEQVTNTQGVPQTFKDGSPKWQLKVPLKQILTHDGSGNWQASPDFPEGEGAWYVKGQGRDELARAMAEASCSGSPKADAMIQVTLVNRRQTGQGFQPANIVAVTYTPAPGEVGQAQQAQSTDAASPAAEPQPAAPAPAPQVQPVQQVTYAQQPVQEYQQAQAPVAQQPVPQAIQQPQAPAQGAPQPPADLAPEQQALLAKLQANAAAAGQ